MKALPRAKEVRHPDGTLRYRLTCDRCGVWNEPTSAAAAAARINHECGRNGGGTTPIHRYGRRP